MPSSSTRARSPMWLVARLATAHAPSRPTAANIAPPDPGTGSNQNGRAAGGHGTNITRRATPSSTARPHRVQASTYGYCTLVPVEPAGAQSSDGRADHCCSSGRRFTQLVGILIRPCWCGLWHRLLGLGRRRCCVGGGAASGLTARHKVPLHRRGQRKRGAEHADAPQLCHQCRPNQKVCQSGPRTPETKHTVANVCSSRVRSPRRHSAGYGGVCFDVERTHDEAEMIPAMETAFSACRASGLKVPRLGVTK